MAECTNEYREVDLSIVDQRVIDLTTKKEKKILSTKIKFFENVLFSTVICALANCSTSHPKYGVYVSDNLPVIFDSHEEDDTIYYVPYRNRVIHPFRMPKVGDTLITGIRWNTVNPGPKKWGVTNSCMIDGFLTDLKLRSLDKDFCFECLFQHEGGPGRNLERCLRTLILHIIMFSKPIHRIGYQQIKKFSYEEDLKIKRIWMDKDCIKLVPIYDVKNGVVNQDLLYRPVVKGNSNFWTYSIKTKT